MVLRYTSIPSEFFLSKPTLSIQSTHAEPNFRPMPCSAFVSIHRFCAEQTLCQSPLYYLDNALIWMKIAYVLRPIMRTIFANAFYIDPILFDDVFEFFSLIPDYNKIIRHQIAFCHCCPIIFCIWKSVNYPMTNWH